MDYYRYTSPNSNPKHSPNPTQPDLRYICIHTHAHYIHLHAHINFIFISDIKSITYRVGQKNGPVCFTVCNFRNVDKICFKFGTNQRISFVSLNRNYLNQVWKIKWRHLANDCGSNAQRFWQRENVQFIHWAKHMARRGSSHKILWGLALGPLHVIKNTMSMIKDGKPSKIWRPATNWEPAPPPGPA